MSRNLSWDGSSLVLAGISGLLVLIQIAVSIVTEPTVGSVISLLAGSGLEPPLVAKISIWLLYFLGFYKTVRNLPASTDRLQRLSTVFDSRRIALFFSGLGITVALLLSNSVLETSRIGTVTSSNVTFWQWLITLGGILSIGSLLFTIHFLRAGSGEPPHQFSLRLFEKPTNSDWLHTLQQAESRVARAQRYLIRLNEGATLAFSAVILGAAVSVVWLFYPIPEFVLFVSSVYVSTRQFLSGRDGTGGSAVDPESPIIRSALSILSSPKGFVAVPLIVLGLFYSAVPFAIVVRSLQSPTHMISSGPLSIDKVSGLSPLELVTLIVHAEFLFALVCAGVFGYWFWYQVAKRLPAFLSAWKRADVESLLFSAIEPAEDYEPETGVQRIDFQLVRIIWMVALCYPLARLMFDTELYHIGFFILFPLTGVAVAWELKKTYHSAPPIALSDQDIFIPAIVSQAILTPVIFIDLNFGVFLQSGLGTIVAIPPFIGAFITPDVSRFASESEGQAKYSRIVLDLCIAGWVLMCGMLMLALPMIPWSMGILLILVGSTVGVWSAIAWGITRKTYT